MEGRMEREGGMEGGMILLVSGGREREGGRVDGLYCSMVNGGWASVCRASQDCHFVV